MKTGNRESVEGRELQDIERKFKFGDKENYST